VAALRGSGVTVLLTSHYLGDIERLAERIVILQSGRITHDLPLERLLEQAGAAAEVTVGGRGEPPSISDVEIDGVRLVGVSTVDGRWTARYEVRDWAPESLRALASLWPDGEIAEVRVQPASLEAVFADLARTETPA
jgi:ABC-2 type transport system ATP-binding protein